MSESPELRLFLAIPLPDDVRAELGRLQLELHLLLPPRGVRWTRVEQFHLTLKFLGNVPATDIEALSLAVRKVCDAAPPMRLRAEGAGFFPNARSPRVFWVNIQSVDDRLKEFQGRLESAVQRFAGKEEGKKFTAHVTLARLEKMGRRERDTLAAVAAVTRTFGEWTAKEVQLIKSSLQRSGAVHAIVDVFKTKNG